MSARSPSNDAVLNKGKPLTDAEWGMMRQHTQLGHDLILQLETWHENYIFPAEKKWVNEDFVYWGTLLAIIEMIRSGTTTFADGYFVKETPGRLELGYGAVMNI
jgi:cytosine/adenosine deaminase-related metal-dependent hydrolase